MIIKVWVILGSPRKEVQVDRREDERDRDRQIVILAQLMRSYRSPPLFT